MVRHSADIIALVELSSILINYLLYPIEQRLPDFADGSFAAELNELILYLIIFAVPFLIAARLSHMRLPDLMGTEKPPVWVYIMTIGLTMGWSFGAGFLGTGIEAALNRFHLTEPANVYVLPLSTSALIIQIIATAIIPPIVEELCYRGFFLSTAVPAMGTWSAIILTGLAFWLAHYSITIFPLALGFSVIGGFVRRRYGSLLPSMCGHFLVNSVYLIVSISFVVLGPDAGAMVAAAIYLIQILFGMIGAVLFVSKGCLSEIWNGTFGHCPALTPLQTVSAVLTSVPVWVLLLIAVYFTAGGLEAF